jgi:hypothetical protein
VLVTSDIVSSNNEQGVCVVCIDKEKELGATTMPFSDLLRAPSLMLYDSFDIGDRAPVRASISLRRLKVAKLKEVTVLFREKAPEAAQ